MIESNRCQVYEPQLLSVEGFSLHRVERSHSWRGEEGGWSFATSCVLICPKCLKQWAHMAFERPQEYLWPIGAFCEACEVERQNTPAGSILINYGYGCNIDEALLDVLPEELLRREFILHLNSRMKETENDAITN